MVVLLQRSQKVNDVHFSFLFSAADFYDSSFTSDFRVHLQSDGTVVWVFGGNVATTCTLDLTYFPFDKQLCTLTIENWAYPSEQVLYSICTTILTNQLNADG